MAKVVACLARGKIVLLSASGAWAAEREQREMRSPAAERLPVQGSAAQAPFVDVSRGRSDDELCYAIRVLGITSVYTQSLSTGEERRLFATEAELDDLDFSFADEALACAVRSKDGTSALGVLRDDGKGMRTVTEGDVLDLEPRWAPGARGEILYASKGVGRSKAGTWVGLSPSSLHRLNLADSTVEVLVSDAKYDYFAPVPLGPSLIYAIRRPYRAPDAPSPWAALAERVRAGLGRPSAARARRPEPYPAPGHLRVGGESVRVAASEHRASESEGSSGERYELVRMTERKMDVIAAGVLAFDITTGGDLVYSDGRGVFRIGVPGPSDAALLAPLEHVERVVIA